jgi:hypothetical protein
MRTMMVGLVGKLRPSINQLVNDVSKTKVTLQNVRKR